MLMLLDTFYSAGENQTDAFAAAAVQAVAMQLASHFIRRPLAGKLPR